MSRGCVQRVESAVTTGRETWQGRVASAPVRRQDIVTTAVFRPRAVGSIVAWVLPLLHVVDCWIGVVQQADRRVVRLAGRLSVAQVPELLEACAEHLPLELDLTDLVSADAAGIEALQRLRGQGATLVGAPGYMQLKLDSPPEAGQRTATEGPSSNRMTSRTLRRAGRSTSGWRRPRPSGHTTPSFFIRNRSVFGWMPRRSAALPAPLIRQPQRSSTLSMCARCTASRLSGASACAAAARAERQRRRRAAACRPLEAIIARSTTFSSSRTLPGHA